METQPGAVVMERGEADHEEQRGDLRQPSAEGENVVHAKVIDVPMRWGPGLMEMVDEALEVKRCSYVGVGDRSCGRRAVENGMCRIHSRWTIWAESGWPMVCPEDRESVAEALRQTLSWLMAGLVDEKKALAVVAICRAILRAT
jgi:hypothetical protein